MISDQLSPSTLPQLQDLFNKFDDLKQNYQYYPKYDYNNYYHVPIKEFIENYDEIISGKYQTQCQMLIIEKCQSISNWKEENKVIIRIPRYMPDEISIMTIGNKVIQRTKSIIECIDVNKYSFRNPKSNQIFQFQKGYLKRKQITDKLLNHYHYGNLRFNNHTYGGIASFLKNLLMPNHYDKWRSSFHPKLRDRIDKYGVTPINQKYDIDRYCEDEWEFYEKNNKSIFYEIEKRRSLNYQYLYYLSEPFIYEYDDLHNNHHSQDIDIGWYPSYSIKTWLECTNFDLSTITKYKYRTPINSNYKSFMIDVDKCYSTAIVKYLKYEKIPIYTTNDNEETFDKDTDLVDGKLPVGLYWVEGFEIPFCKWTFESKFYPHFILNILLKDGVLSIDNIKTKLIARQHLNGEALAKFIIEIYDILSLKEAKTICNVFTGLFNRKYDKEDNVVVSNHIPYVIAMIQEMNKCDKFTLKEMNEYFWLRSLRKTRKNFDTSVIYQYIIAGGILNTYEMVKSIWRPEYQLIGVQTDAVCIGVVGEKDLIKPTFMPKFPQDSQFPISVVLNNPYHYEWKKIQPEATNIEIEKYIKPDYIDLEFNQIRYEPNIDLTKEDGCILDAKGGAGKTFTAVKTMKKLMEIKQPHERVVMVAFQGSVVANFQDEIAKQDFYNDECYTIDLFFGNVLENGRMVKRKATYYKNIIAIFIDEKSQLSHDHMRQLVRLKMQEPSIKFYPIGDKNQCESVQTPLYLLEKTQALKYLTTNYMTMPYNPEYARSTQENKEQIDYLIEHKKLDPQFWGEKDNNGNYIYEQKILNENERGITKYRYDKPTSCNVINESFEIKIDGQIVCENAFRTAEGKVCRGQTFKVIDIRDNEVKIIVRKEDEKNECWFPIIYTNQQGVNTTIFAVATAETIYRLQGQTIKENQIIYDIHKMSWESAITSISRANTHEHIKLFDVQRALDKKFKSVYDIQQDILIPAKSKDNNFKKYILYRISNDSNQEYYGITEINFDYHHKIKNVVKYLINNQFDNVLRNRLKQHLDSYNDKYPSAVLEMEQPVKIESYYSRAKSILYGTQKHIQEIEQQHIRMNYYYNKKVKVMNKDIQNKRRSLNNENKMKIDIVKQQIQQYIRGIKITKPTSKCNQYVINDTNLAKANNYKSSTMKKSNVNDLRMLIMNGISKLMNCEKSKVNEAYQEIRNELIQQFKNNDRHINL